MQQPAAVSEVDYDSEGSIEIELRVIIGNPGEMNESSSEAVERRADIQRQITKRKSARDNARRKKKARTKNGT